MKVEQIVLNEERNVTLTAYLQEVGGEFRNVAKRPAMLVLPGGGYQFCSDREADPVAMPYLKAGYHVFILRYSLQKDATWPNPLNDYDQAMALIREKADEWKLYADKVAVIGFSAGGHLAASAATMSKNRPNAAILGYPVINEENAKIWERTAPDTVGAVDKETCPCFVFATCNDTTVPVENSLQFLSALAANGITFESHIYAYGPHGFSTADANLLTPGTHICNRAPHWVEDSVEWLKDVFGALGDGVMTEPAVGRFVNGNNEEYLSIGCTMGYLMKNEKAAAVLGGLMQGMQAVVGAGGADEAAGGASGVHENAGGAAKAEGQGTDAGGAGNAKDMAAAMSPEAMQHMMDHMILGDMLRFGQVPKEAVEQIDAQLKGIPNK